MSYITHKLPILVIRHRWTLPLGIPYNRGSYSTLTKLTSFVSDDLPGVKFDIVSGTSTESGGLVLVISKTPLEPVKVMIKIFDGTTEKESVDLDNWVDPYISAGISGVSYCSELQCEITWYGSVKKLQIINLYQSVKHLLNKQELSDFVIIVGDVKIPVHKVILAVQSPYFSAMFTIDMIESTNNKLIVEDIEVEIMQRVIEFLYTGEIDVKLDVDIVISILSVADKYQIMTLKDYCAEVLATKLTVNNMLKIAENASLYGVPQLVDQTIDFLICNNHAIVELEGFDDFGYKNPQILVKYSIRISKILQTASDNKNPFLKYT